MNKKGYQMYEIILGLVVMGAILLWWFGVFTPTSAEAGQIFSSEILKAKVSKCGFDTQRAIEKGLVLTKDNNDRDEDGLEDICDPCVCSSQCCKNNDITKDNDRDGMPNCCDKKPDDGKVIGCNFVSVDGRCVEGAAPYAKRVG